MFTPSREKVIVWLRSKVVGSADECNAIEARSFISNDRVNVFETKKGDGELKNCDELASEIIEFLTTDAYGSGESTAYKLHPIYGSGSSATVAGRFNCRVEVVGDDPEGGSSFAFESGNKLGESELKHPKGVQFQQMRHNEKLMQMFAGVVGEQMRNSSRQLEAVLQRNTELERMHSEDMRLREEAVSRKFEREIELMKQTHLERRKEMFFQQAMPLVPHAIGKLTGMNIPIFPVQNQPQKITANVGKYEEETASEEFVACMRTVLDALDTTQKVKTISAKLTDNAKSALAEIIVAPENNLLSVFKRNMRIILGSITSIPEFEGLANSFSEEAKGALVYIYQELQAEFKAKASNNGVPIPATS